MPHQADQQSKRQLDQDRSRYRQPKVALIEAPLDSRPVQSGKSDSQGDREHRGQHIDAHAKGEAKEKQEHRGGHRPALTQRFVPQQVGKCSRHDLDPT